MNLRHLQWFIDEPLPDPEVTLYQISPYSREDTARIIRHLCALAKIDLGQMGEDPASAERTRQALGRVVHAACARQALLDLNKIDRDIGKPPWRDRLRDLRNDRRQFATAIGDKSARTAPQWALIDIRQASRAGRRWLHYLRDHPAVLRKTIERALEALILQRDVGRTDRLDRVLFVEDVSRAYELLTGEPLGRSVTSDTKSRPGGRPTGPGLRLVWICLKPLDPLITDDAVAWAIRRVQERASVLTH